MNTDTPDLLNGTANGATNGGAAGDITPKRERPRSPAKTPPAAAATQPEREESRDWDWADAREEGLIFCEEQPRTAVYTNPAGAVVIRQEGTMEHLHDDDDGFVFVHRSYVANLCQAMLEQAGLTNFAVCEGHENGHWEPVAEDPRPRVRRA